MTSPRTLSPPSSPSAEKSRRTPAFTLAGDSEDELSPIESPVGRRPPRAPRILVNDAPPGENGRNHVNFAAAPTPDDAFPAQATLGVRADELEKDAQPDKASVPETSEPSCPPTERIPSDPPHPARDSPPPAKTSKKRRKLPPLPSALAWIPPQLNWKGLRPVIRSSIAAWCGLLLLLCDSSERMLGRAGYLVLVVAALSPACQPIASTLETVFFQFLFVAIAWAWTCIALAIAHASRTTYKFTQSEFQAYAAQQFAQPGMTAAEVQAAATDAIFHGAFIEAPSSAVCAIFLGAGCGFFLWFRGYAGPGPTTFGVIFAMLNIIISLTVGGLFPYAYYSIGLSFMIPFACQQAIILACTFLIFPETLAHQFTDRLIAALHPLQSVIHDQARMLNSNPRTSEWLEFKSLKANANAAVTAVGLLGASEANLTREVSYGRVNGRDLSVILQNMRILVARTSGFVFFYEVVEKHLHRDESQAKGGPVADDLVIHLGRSRAGTPEVTPGSTRPPSPSRAEGEDTTDSETARHAGELGSALQKLRARNERGEQSRPTHGFGRSRSSPGPSVSSMQGSEDVAPRRSRGDLHDAHAQAAQYRHGHHFPHTHRHQFAHSPRSGHHHRHRGSHLDEKRRSRSRTRHSKTASSHVSLPGLLHDVLHPQVDIRPVGVVESTVYADLEDYLSNPRDEEHLEEIIHLLAAASRTLLETVEESVHHLIDVLHRFKSLDDTIRAAFRYNKAEVDEKINTSQAQLDKLRAAIVEYRETKRLEVVRPFAGVFDPYGAEMRDGDFGEGKLQAPSHRGLFWCFQYEHCLLGWSEALVDIYETILRFEKKRRRPRFWFPTWRKAKFRSQQGDEYGDDDPEDLRDLDTRAFSAARNPDYKPPKSLSQRFAIQLHHLGDIATRRDVLFAVKLSFVVGLTSMPAFFPSTAWFFYSERGIWALSMLVLTSNQFLGDVLFGYVVRVIGTLVGAAVGLCLWSIAAQKGEGNPFALAAVCAVAFPPIFFYRVHMQPIMTAILPTLTIALVIGFSWQGAHNPSLSSVGYGWDVAWRRFITVLIGITIAFIASLLPPSSRQKVSIRRTYAKVIYRMGDVVCQIISFANCKAGPTKAPRIIVNNLAALRLRVNRTVQARAMARYELSMQGAWPSELYAAVQALLMEMLDLLGQLAMVISYLDQRWTRALLHRSQLANPRFLQQVLTTLQLISTALDHGAPLPYIYNPLLEQFLKSPEVIASGHANGYGYEIQLGDDDVEGLPHHVDFATICSIDYLRFSSGVSQAYAIVNRLDRLMFTVKSLVGENYLLYGLQDRVSHHGNSERDGLLDEHFHGASDSRRSSLDGSSIV